MENSWRTVVGLEIHAQITSRSKLFSGASAALGTSPNSQVSYIDAGFPGMLPVINQECVDQGIRTGLGLKGRINLLSVFDRKNYFYPDLPAGYQISQYGAPLVSGGQVRFVDKQGRTKTIRVRRVHLETDAGKSLHDQNPLYSYIDLNRSGIGLMEIVTEPDISSGEEASLFLRKLRTLLRYLGVCDGNMEQGSLRCDANVSVHRPETPFGTRCEIKNLNSIRFVHQAIEYEARRQIQRLENGDPISQETRLWDKSGHVTHPMRSKEEANDYRYFPDPDLVPLRLEEERIERLRQALPELPDEKKDRFQIQYGLSDYDAEVLVTDKRRADFFEEATQGRDPKQVVGWVNTELFGALNKANLTLDASPISAQALGDLIDFIHDQTISGKIAKQVFETMFATGQTASAVIQEQGLRQVSDSAILAQEIDSVLAEHPEKIVEYQQGKQKLFGFFVGQIMRRTKGQGNPALINQLLHAKLSNDS